MITINQGKNIVKKMAFSYADKKRTPATVALDIQEAVTKLALAFRLKKGKAEIEKRIANVLISAFDAADFFKIKDLEKIFTKRIQQLKREMKK